VTPDSAMNYLNRMIAADPVLSQVFAAAAPRAPRLLWYALGKKDSGGRWDRRFAYTVKKVRGPGSGPVGYYTLEYRVEPVPGGYNLRLMRSAHAARRKIAAARALRWYKTAKAAADARKARGAVPTVPAPPAGQTAPPAPSAEPVSDPEDPRGVAHDPEDP
jgi:hypothetical protein